MNKKLLALGLVAALTGTGCYGRFALTKSFHGWNGNIGNRWVNSLVFFGLVVVQAYSLSLLADGIVLNTIEFWTGSNPVATVQEDGSILVVDGGREHRLVPLEGGRWGLDVQGQRVAEAELMADGSLAIVDEATSRSTYVTSEQMNTMFAAQ